MIQIRQIKNVLEYATRDFFLEVKPMNPKLVNNVTLMKRSFVLAFLNNKRQDKS